MAIESIKERLRQLLEMGDRVLSTKHPPGPGVIAPDFVDTALYYEWQASSLSFLSRVFGEEHIHFKGFQEKCKVSYHGDAVRGQSILKAANDDIASGYLKKLDSIVAADIFNDFIEMAEYLIKQGYKDPAASLIGAVLEDGLRKIAISHEIKVREREDIGSLNSKLAEAGIYNKITLKRIQIWNDIRNNADHGKFSEYNIELVKEMISGVRDFLGQYL
jgi:hypothetical protein